MRVIFVFIMTFLLISPVVLNTEGNEKLQKIFDFESDEPVPGLYLSQLGEGDGPVIEDDYLTLINGGWRNHHNNVVQFPQIIADLYTIWELSWKMYITPGAEGCGFAFLNTEIFPEDNLSFNLENWTQPNFERSFAIGFDIHDPPSSHWFDANGNFYDRPQREISLHWDWQEMVKILSPVEFRANQEIDDDFHEYQLTANFVTGGAEITLLIDETKIFDRYFVPRMQPYPYRLILGGTTGELTTSIYLDDIDIEYVNQVDRPQKPLLIEAIREQPIYIDTRDTSHQVKFPDNLEDFGRIVMNLELGEMPGGYDPWDKGAALYVWDDSTRYEICRFITPYGRGYIWQVDVTDFKPVLNGERQVDLHVDTWMQKEEDPQKQKGWTANIDFEFYTGFADRPPIEVHNIWNGYYEYGNPVDPLEAHLEQNNIICPENAGSARLRVVVTGHGMHPNHLNAAEFMPAGRTIYISGKSYENTLWKTDCYLNPCRPQGGTWKFDRAGWAPGSVVEPWIIELEEMSPGDTLKLDYLPDAYLNISEGDHYRAHHWIESQLIFYGE